MTQEFKVCHSNHSNEAVTTTAPLIRSTHRVQTDRLPFISHTDVSAGLHMFTVRCSEGVQDSGIWTTALTFSTASRPRGSSMFPPKTTHVKTRSRPPHRSALPPPFPPFHSAALLSVTSHHLLFVVSSHRRVNSDLQAGDVAHLWNAFIYANWRVEAKHSAIGSTQILMRWRSCYKGVKSFIYSPCSSLRGNT